MIAPQGFYARQGFYSRYERTILGVGAIALFLAFW